MSRIQNFGNSSINTPNLETHTGGIIQNINNSHLDIEINEPQKNIVM